MFAFITSEEFIQIKTVDGCVQACSFIILLCRTNMILYNIQV